MCRIKVPRNVDEDYGINKINRDLWWKDAINKVIKMIPNHNIFEFHDPGHYLNIQEGWQHAPYRWLHPLNAI